MECTLSILQLGEQLQHLDPGQLLWRQGFTALLAVETVVMRDDPRLRRVNARMGEEIALVDQSLPISDSSASNLFVPVEGKLLHAVMERAQAGDSALVLGVVVNGNASPLQRQDAIGDRVFRPRKYLDAASAPCTDRNGPFIKRKEADLVGIKVYGHLLCLKDKPLSLRHRPTPGRKVTAQSS